MQYFLLILGLILVVKSADILIDSASKIAKRFGVSTFVIGITVVAFGTSAPELAVGIISGISHTNQLTLGNIIGSGVANIAWIIGITSVIMPLTVKKSVIRREIPVLIIIEIALTLMLFINGTLSRINGIILIAGFIGFMAYIILSTKKATKLQLLSQTELEKKVVDGSEDCKGLESNQNEGCNSEMLEPQKICEEESSKQPTEKKQLAKLWIFAIVSLIGLFIGGKLTVDSSSNIAQSFGLSETLIGLTVVAFATTLPELVASLMAVIKKEPDIILGNCIGSNTFNILLVLGASSIISPIAVDNTLWIDMAVFFGVTMFVFIVSLIRKSLRRPAGILLLLTYICYITYNILAVTVL